MATARRRCCCGDEPVEAQCCPTAQQWAAFPAGSTWCGFALDEIKRLTIDFSASLTVHVTPENEGFTWSHSGSGVVEVEAGEIPPSCNMPAASYAYGEGDLGGENPTDVRNARAAAIYRNLKNFPLAVRPAIETTTSGGGLNGGVLEVILADVIDAEPANLNQFHTRFSAGFLFNQGVSASVEHRYNGTGFHSSSGGQLVSESGPCYSAWSISISLDETKKLGPGTGDSSLRMASTWDVSVMMEGLQQCLRP